MDNRGYATGSQGRGLEWRYKFGRNQHKAETGQEDPRTEVWGAQQGKEDEPARRLRRRRQGGGKKLKRVRGRNYVMKK